MSEKIQAVKGMNDLLPPDSARWEWFEDRVRALMRRYGYASIRTPIVEPTPLFVRGLGEVTDIVEKEMFAFEDRPDKHGRRDQLCLRPEGTAGVVRAVVENGLLYEGGRRLFYIGPMFRHEKPQKGRYRQFHQVGVEALGFAGPDVDAEVILMARSLWRDLGLTDVRLEINSLGQPDERQAHRTALIAHFEAHADLLDEEARRRLHSNPLRILDTKNPAMQTVVEAAPQDRVLLVGLITFIVGAVGQLQFEVMADRLANEYALDVIFEASPYAEARWMAGADAEIEDFSNKHKTAVAEDIDNQPVFLAKSAWEINYVAERYPKVRFLKTRERG